MHLLRYSGIGFAALFMACGVSRVASVANYGLGEACRDTAECRVPLICSADQCTPPETEPVGSFCVLTPDCLPGLFCDRGSCAPAGEVLEGGFCAYTRECTAGLHCAFAGLGGRCTSGSAGPEGDLEDRCGSSRDCVAGLLCDAITATCESIPAEPQGDACTTDADCCESTSACDHVSRRGIVCRPPAAGGANICTGLGPDDQPVPVWQGTDCAPSNALDGDFRVLFEVPDGGTAPFYSLPFPNDIRINAAGMVDLSGHPAPPLTSVPADLMGNYLRAAQDQQEGFGPNQSVFMRFSGPPLFCAESCGGASGTPCAPGCVDSRGTDATVYVVDISRNNSGGFLANPFTPISYQWFASSGRTQYLCWNWISFVPQATSPWVPGHTYMIFVHTGLKGAGGDAIVQDTDFATMTQASRPSNAILATAWDRYEPLRAWLATSPTYPSETIVVAAADMAGAALFTVRDPTSSVQAIAAAIDAAPAPAEAAVSEIVDCGTSPTPESCDTADLTGIRELQGTLTLPNFQQGAAPYLEEGGGIANVSGVAQQAGSITTRFSLSLPDDTLNGSAAWPVVIFAHGTGGNYRSHLTSGVAADLGAALFGSRTEQIAVLGIDQVMHGNRAGGSSLDPELLFFNFSNPDAARGNVLQAAADQLFLAKAMDALTAALSTAGVADSALDPTMVAFLGHSQGALAGIPAASVTADMTSVAFSGAGGGLIDTLMLKTSPYDLPTIMKGLLSDPAMTDARVHPGMSIIQGWLEDVDPINFGPHISSQPIGSATPKHMLHVIGASDSYTPNATSMNFARRVGVRFMDDETSGLPGASDAIATAGDNQANVGGLTRVGTIHVPGDYDGHFVLFKNAEAARRVSAFFASWVNDSGQVPTVVE